MVKSAQHHVISLVSCRECFLGEVVALLVAIAHIELMQHGIAEAAFSEI